MRVLLTGYSGFIGSRFLEYNKDKYDIIPQNLRSCQISEIVWTEFDAVVHMAGKAHKMPRGEKVENYDINWTLTQDLAIAAKKNGVRHFIYLSSLKVFDDDLAFIDDTTPLNPISHYGLSKLKAEDLLREMSSSDFKVAIIRPPVVYGPGVKGNMLRLLKICETPWPLPFKSATNGRSMVYLDNLIEFINRVIDVRAEGSFFSNDLEAISTNKLVSLIRVNMNRKVKVFRLPDLVLWGLRNIKPNIIKRLYDSFVVDVRNTNKQLQFIPPYATEIGVKKMVDWYLNDCD